MRILLTLLLMFSFTAHAESYFEAAQRYAESNQHTEARRALRQEIRVRPRNVVARYDLAVLLENIGHEAEAITLYKENMQHKPHLPSIVNLSSIYLAHHQHKQAEALLLDATKRFRAESIPWYLLAKISEQTGDTNLADTRYQRAIKVDSRNGFAHIRYARFLAGQHRMQAATLHAKQAITLRPNCAECLHIAGDVLEQGGKKKQALIAYQKSVAIMPDHRLHIHITQLLQSMSIEQ